MLHLHLIESSWPSYDGVQWSNPFSRQGNRRKRSSLAKVIKQVRRKTEILLHLTSKPMVSIPYITHSYLSPFTKQFLLPGRHFLLLLFLRLAYLGGTESDCIFPIKFPWPPDTEWFFLPWNCHSNLVTLLEYKSQYYLIAVSINFFLITMCLKSRDSLLLNFISQEPSALVRILVGWTV